MSDPVVNEELAFGLITVMAASGGATYPFTMRKDPSTNVFVGSEPEKIPRANVSLSGCENGITQFVTCKLGGVTEGRLSAPKNVAPPLRLKKKLTFPVDPPPVQRSWMVFPVEIVVMPLLTTTPV